MSAVAPLRVQSAEELLADDPRFQATLKVVEEIRKRDEAAKLVDQHIRAANQVSQEAASARRGTYRKLDKLLSERTYVDWLIRDELEAGVIALLAGPKGSYKSTYANGVAMRVALKGLPVFILSPEGSGLQRRLQGWLNEFAPFEDAGALPLYVRDRRLNLSAAEEMAALVGWLNDIEKETGKPIAFIAIDTWSKATAHDEDNNTQTKLLLGEIDKHLRHRGVKPATVLIVAHTGHTNQGRARGASALAADTDAEYIVSYKSETVSVTRSRFKDSPALPPLYFKPKPLTLDYADATGIKQTSVVLLPADAPGKSRQDMTPLQAKLFDHALKVITDNGGTATADAIVADIEGESGALKRRLKSLEGRGLMLVGDQYSVAPSIVCTKEFES